MQFYNNFIGYEPKYQNEKFSGSDTEKRFNQLLIEQSDNWYYCTHPISYIRNSTGHRSKELADLDLNNYILFAGCSITEGIGLELEKTYPYITSKILNTDYYNLGLGSTGIDVLSYNLVQWHNLVKIEPKVLVIQWPGLARYSIINKDNEDILDTIGPWIKGIEIDKFLVYGQAHNVSYFSSKKFILQKLIKSLFTCPIIEIDLSEIHTNKNDCARDEMHPGIESHSRITNTVTKKIQNAIR